MPEAAENPFPPSTSLWRPLLAKLSIVLTVKEGCLSEFCPLLQSVYGRVNLELRDNTLITGTDSSLQYHQPSALFGLESCVTVELVNF